MPVYFVDRDCVFSVSDMVAMVKTARHGARAFIVLKDNSHHATMTSVRSLRLRAQKMPH